MTSAQKLRIARFLRIIFMFKKYLYDLQNTLHLVDETNIAKDATVYFVLYILIYHLYNIFYIFIYNFIHYFNFYIKYVIASCELFMSSPR